MTEADDSPRMGRTVDSRHRQSAAGPDLVRQAESLIRSLSGVVHARIESGDRGIDSIHVTAADDAAATHMAAHVRSALLAGLATPVIAGRIHVRVDPAATRAAPSTTTNGNGNGNGNGTTHADAHDARHGGRHSIRLIHHAVPDGEGDGGADGDEDAGPQAGSPAPARPATAIAEDTDDEPVAAPASAATARTAHAPAPPATAIPGDAAFTRRAAVDRPRLVAVDVQRRENGRVVCRVSIAYNACVHRAEAIAIDLPGAAAQAAAQAAVRAMVDAGIQGLELAGLREVEIAGREYVLVALRRVEGRLARDRSGSAAMIGSPERSAAEAAVAAADALA